MQQPQTPELNMVVGYETRSLRYTCHAMHAASLGAAAAVAALGLHICFMGVLCHVRDPPLTLCPAMRKVCQAFAHAHGSQNRWLDLLGLDA
jgi:hypothetical protein